MLPDKEQALELLQKYIKSPNMYKHSIASGAVMARVARHLGYDTHKWYITGLLHDLDAEITSDNPHEHGLKTAAILRDLGVDEDVIDAIIVHNDMASDRPRTKEFHHALAACETITGMITATTLVYPDKKITSVKPKSVKKRMKDKSFAASVRRENIMECEKIGIPLDEFIVLAMEGMKTVQEELGL
jgi:putative nucleotidyltransferase with HDIG domain